MANGNDGGLLHPQQRLGGIWGPQFNQTIVRDERGPSLLDRILGMYGPDPTSHIPDEYRRGATGAGLRGAGLAALAASGGLERQGFPQVLGAALAGGQQARGQYAAAIQAKQRQDQLRAMVQAGAGPEQLQAIMLELLAGGDTEGAKAVSEVLKSMQASQPKPIQVAPGGTLYDPISREAIFTAPQNPGTAGKPVKVFDPGQGKEVYATWDPDSRSFIPIQGNFVPKPGSPGNPTELERRAGMFVPLAKAAERQIRAFEQLEGVPSRMSQFADWTSLNEALPQETQLLYAAGRQLGDAYLRMTSGAAIKEEEVQMFIRSFLPYPGDSPAVIEFKRTQREHFIRGLEVIGQRALDGYVDREEALSPEFIQGVIETGSGAPAGDGVGFEGLEEW